jgi:hypothetical protein
MSFSPFRTLTVGSGISPDLLDPAATQQALAGSPEDGITAGGDFHPALRIIIAFAPPEPRNDFLSESSWQMLQILM